MTRNLSNSKDTARWRKYKVIHDHIGEFKLQGKDKYYLSHFLDLAEKREHKIEFACSLYHLVYPGSREVNFPRFYYWYKNNPLTEDELHLYHLYAPVARHYTDDQIRLEPFCDKGEWLLCKLSDWATTSSENSIEELVNKYFSITVPAAWAWQPPIITNPKSLLGPYGWNLFLDGVSKTHGDKWSWLRLGKQEKHSYAIHGDKLLLYQRVRLEMLQSEDLAIYDEMGDILNSQGIDRALLHYGI